MIQSDKTDSHNAQPASERAPSNRPGAHVPPADRRGAPMTLTDRYWQCVTSSTQKTGLALLLTGFAWFCAVLAAETYKPVHKPAASACALALN